MEAVSTSVQDSSVLVQRSTLDLILFCFPFHMSQVTILIYLRLLSPLFVPMLGTFLKVLFEIHLLLLLRWQSYLSTFKTDICRFGFNYELFTSHKIEMLV